MKYTDPDGDMIQLKSVQSRLPCRVASARIDPLSALSFFSRTQDDWLVCIEDHESDQIELHATILEPTRYR